MAADLGLYLNSINTTKKNVMRDLEADPSVVTQYPGFIINRLLSYHQDCVLIVNAINKLPQLDPQMQYEFLLNGLDKKKRYSKLHKAVTPENVGLMMKYYKYSVRKAVEVLELHTEEDFKRIRAELSEGGVLREKNKRK
jgi:hypothetical protein